MYFFTPELCHQRVKSFIESAQLRIHMLRIHSDSWSYSYQLFPVIDAVSSHIIIYDELKSEKVLSCDQWISGQSRSVALAT
jgi:hypothetical protein